MTILRRISLAIGLASLAFSVAYAGTTLPKVTDPKPATMPAGQQSNVAILPLPNKGTSGEKKMPKSAGPNNSSSSSVVDQDVQLIPIPQPAPSRQ